MEFPNVFGTHIILPCALCGRYGPEEPDLHDYIYIFFGPTFLAFKIFLKIIIIIMCAPLCVCFILYLLRSQDNFVDLILSSHLHVNSKD